MRYLLQRYSDNGNSTQGIIIDMTGQKAKFQCYSMEDEFREVKVSGETRIPAGLYEIKKRETLSPLTKKYRAKFDWFDYHLELQDIAGFSYVYIHIGNSERDTDACVLVSNHANNNQVAAGFNAQSTDAYELLYRQVSNYLNTGNKVFLEIRDEKSLL